MIKSSKIITEKWLLRNKGLSVLFRLRQHSTATVFLCRLGNNISIKMNKKGKILVLGAPPICTYLREMK